MKVNPYLNFAGNCREAFTHYRNVLGGEITAMSTFRETPAAAHMPADWQDKIMHACLVADGQMIMASDAPPGNQQKPQGFMVTVTVDEPAEAERIWSAFADGGEVHMPLDETFWATRFGMVTDRFGTPWMVSCNRAEPAAA